MGLRQLTAKTVTKTINLGGKDGLDPLPITLTFRPAGYTAELEEKYREQLETERGAGATVEFLLGFLDAWDLKWDDADKKPIPITREALSKIDILSLKGIIEGIQDDLMPDFQTPR